MDDGRAVRLGQLEGWGAGGQTTQEWRVVAVNDAWEYALLRARWQRHVECVGWGAGIRRRVRIHRDDHR